MPARKAKIAAASAADRQFQLKALVTSIIDSDPYQLLDVKWAARPQEFYCDALGISPATLRRWIGKPPFDRRRVQIDDKVVTLLRIGKPLPKTPIDHARIMASIWRKHTGREGTKRDFGCLIGLAEIWPEGKAPAIFKHALDNWQAVALGIKLAMITDPSWKDRYFSHPVVSMMRKCPSAVLGRVLING